MHVGVYRGLKGKASRRVGNTCHPADSVLSWFLPLPPDTILATVLVPSGYSTDLQQQSWEDRLCSLLNAI